MLVPHFTDRKTEESRSPMTAKDHEHKVAEPGFSPKSAHFDLEPPPTTPLHAWCFSAQMDMKTEVAEQAYWKVRLSAHRVTEKRPGNLEFVDALL